MNVKWCKNSIEFNFQYEMMLCNLHLGNLTQVQSLIGGAADVKKLVNTKNEHGSTLLHDAAYYGRFISLFYKSNAFEECSIFFG